MHRSVGEQSGESMESDLKFAEKEGFKPGTRE